MLRSQQKKRAEQKRVKLKYVNNERNQIKIYTMITKLISIKCTYIANKR